MEIIKNKINNNTIKYQFLKPDKGKLTYAEFISFLKSKDELFHEKFWAALNDATSELSAYFWECIPVSKQTINKPFEFVVIKSEKLNNIKQNWTSFGTHISNNHQKWACSFPGLSGDNVLIIPIPKPGSDLDFKNISQFTKNAPEEQQQAFWQEVANKLMEELEKNPDVPRWLNTEGTGVSYLHVRIDSRPKYYSWEEYKELRASNDEINYSKDDKLPITGTNKSALTTNQPENESSPNASPIKKNPSSSNDYSISQPSNSNYNNKSPKTDNKKPENKNNNPATQRDFKTPSKIASDNSQSAGRILIITSLIVGVIAIFALIIYWRKGKAK